MRKNEQLTRTTYAAINTMTSAGRRLGGGGASTGTGAGGGAGAGGGGSELTTACAAGFGALRAVGMMLTTTRACYVAVVVAWIYAARAAARSEPAALQLLIVVTALWVIATNLGTRREGEASAYSVFNNGVALPGQLRPEQFEDEIRHRELDPSASAGFGAGASEEEYVRPFQAPDNAEVLMAPDRHERILAELRREALEVRRHRNPHRPRASSRSRLR